MDESERAVIAAYELLFEDLPYGLDPTPACWTPQERTKLELVRQAGEWLRKRADR